jgi:type VI protein secretion system component VasK
MQSRLRAAHPVFWLLLGAAGIALAAALTVDGTPSPGVALGSGVLHRLVVFGAVLVIAYAVVMIMWLAYQGRWASVQAPGVGAGVEPAAQIDRAADDLDAYQRDTLTRLAEHDEVLRQLRDRLTALEERDPG